MGPKSKRIANQGWSRYPNLISLVIIAIFLLVCCGEIPLKEASTPAISYDLERYFISENPNSISIGGIAGAYASVSGKGLTFLVGDPSRISLPAKVDFEYSAFGQYDLNLDVMEADGSILVSDTLKSEYLDKKIAEPIIALDRAATNDVLVNLLISKSISKDVTEIRVEGDVIEGGDIWQQIPITSKVLVKLTNPDGLKKLSVSLRNIYGNVSQPVLFTIEKKSTPLENCTMMILQDTISGNEIEVFASATDTLSESRNLPFYFRALSPDLEKPMNFQSFIKEGIHKIKYKRDIEKIHFTCQIKDHAGNFCPQQEFDIRIDPDFIRNSFNIVGQQYWTDNRNLTLSIDRRYFPNRPPEIFIDGRVEITDQTFQWIAIQPSVPVTLVAVRGPRHIRMKFRYPNSEYTPESDGPEFIESEMYIKSIYLSPFATLSGSSNPYTLGFVDIPGVTDMTATGCDQSIHFTESTMTTTPCTTDQSQVEIKYLFQDGTSVTRSLPVH